MGGDTGVGGKREVEVEAELEHPEESNEEESEEPESGASVEGEEGLGGSGGFLGGVKEGLNRGGGDGVDDLRRNGDVGQLASVVLPLGH